MPRNQPQQQAAPVQRLRVRYAKRGRARFTSHRDFARAFERALRRAGVPMAYSSGFSPHPRISYANASPTSAATEAEYLEIGLAEACDADAVRVALDAALPSGLDVLAVVEAEPGALADRLTASAWVVDLGEVPQAVLERAVASLLAADQWQVQRMTKSGLRDFDVRGAIMGLTVEAGGRLHVVSRHSTPLVRPDDIVQALKQIEPDLTGALPLLTRVAQGEGVVGEEGPLIIDPFTGDAAHLW